MAIARISRFSGTISLLITIFSLSLPAYAKYSGGTGEPDDPYQIATAEDLMLLGETPEDYYKHFILTDDIDLDPNLPERKVFDRAVIAPDTDNSQGDFQGTVFGGVFDGDDHTISNLTIDTAGVAKDYLALFGEIRGENAEVKNIGVVNHKIITGDSHPEFFGGLVGRNFNGSISNCFAIGSITGGNSAENFGGLCGHNDFGTISNCYAAGSVTGNSCDYLGGLCGESFGNIINCYATTTVVGKGESWNLGGLCGGNTGTISNCYAKGSVISRNDDSVYLGGLCGENSGLISNCYASGVVDVGNGSNYTGGLCGYNDINGYISNCFWDIQTSGQTISDGGTGKITTEMRMAGTFLEAGWDFVDETENGTDDIWKIVDGVGYPCLSWQKFNGGTGEPNNPYLISTADQLRAIGDLTLFDKNFMLIADIDLDPNIPGNEILIDRPFIDSFHGTLDGNGHIISNMVSKCNSWERGIGYKSSGLIGHLSMSGIVKNVQLQNITILGVGHHVGALVVSNRGMILQCSITGSITGESFIGGLVADNFGDIVSCSAFCNVRMLPGGPVGVAGGLVGINYGCIYNCYAISAVTGYEDVGGLVGTNYSYIYNCYSKSIVTGSEFVGGLVGESTHYVSNCYAIGTVTGDESVGGLIGINKFSHTTVFQCYAACEIIANPNDSIGGLVGKSSGRSLNSFWDIQVSGQTVSAGGTGLSTAELQDAVTYLSAGWDMAGEKSNGLADIWTITEPNAYPQLSRLTDQCSITQLPGSGTLDDPYEITTAADLVAINDYDINAHYALVADIDLSSIVWATAPIFFFDGTLDGQEHTITNLTIEGGRYLGLFAKIITHGVVTNLTIQDANINGYNYIGAIAGESYGHITNCHVTGNITGESYVAGLVGLAKILYWTTLEEYISDCTSDAVLSGNDHVHNIANAFFYD